MSSKKPKKLSPAEPSTVVDETAVPSGAAVEGSPLQRPSVDELLAATTVEVATVQPRSCPIVIAGVLCTPEPRTYAVASIAALGPSFVRALAEDEQITVRIVE